MSDGLFQGLDIASAEDDPWSVPSDVYDMVISDVDTKESEKDGVTKNNMIIEYTVENHDRYDGRSVQEWKWVPTQEQLESPDKEMARNAADALSYLKQRLGHFGIPESRMNTVTRDDLIGLALRVTVKKNGDFTNVRKVELRAPGGSGDGSVEIDNADVFGG